MIDIIYLDWEGDPEQIYVSGWIDISLAKKEATEFATVEYDLRDVNIRRIYHAYGRWEFMGYNSYFEDSTTRTIKTYNNSGRGKFKVTVVDLWYPPRDWTVNRCDVMLNDHKRCPNTAKAQIPNNWQSDKGLISGRRVHLCFDCYSKFNAHKRLSLFCGGKIGGDKYYGRHVVCTEDILPEPVLGETLYLDIPEYWRTYK